MLKTQKNQPHVSCWWFRPVSSATFFNGGRYFPASLVSLHVETVDARFKTYLALYLWQSSVGSQGGYATIKIYLRV
jgi:hypothetical protein